MQASIIIAVHNKWELTHTCLTALAQTISPTTAEVIVVDLASSDATASSCSALGKKLFGANFKYIHLDLNLDFGQAVTLGARKASGSHLVFLNNATAPNPGWLEPLLDDFRTFSNLAATGPLLTYPAIPCLGETVRHLGMFVNQNLKAGPLYEGIPADSPLALKRRFFQLITATCMVTPKELFLRYEGFGPYQSSGFEDLGLCARLQSAGYGVTVNPKSRVTYFERHDVGRHAREAHSLQSLIEKSVQLISPDWHLLLAKDGLVPALSPWLVNYPAEPQAEEPFPPDVETLELAELIARRPFDQTLYLALADNLLAVGEHAAGTAVLETAFKLMPGPECAQALLDASQKSGDRSLARQATAILGFFARPFSDYVDLAKTQMNLCRKMGLNGLAVLYAGWLEQREDIFCTHYHPFMERRKQRREENKCSTGRPRVSVIIPAYNAAEYLPLTLENILNEPGVELDVVVVNDGSSDGTLDAAKAFGSEIRCFSQENQGPSAARNMGLDHATGDYLIFLDADDLLYPGTILNQYETLAAHPEAGLALCFNQLFTDQTPIAPFASAGYFPLLKAHFDTHFCHRNIAPIHCFMIRTADAHRVGRFDANLRAVEDYDFWLRAVAAGSRIVLNVEGLALYRQHSQNTSKQSLSMVLHECLMRERVHNLLDLNATFLSERKPDGWIAHASRCVALAVLMCDCNPEMTREMIALGDKAIKKTFKTIALRGKQWTHDEASEAGFLSNLLSLVDNARKLEANGEHSLSDSVGSLIKIFPQAGAGGLERIRLYTKLNDCQYASPLLIKDFSTWELTKMG